ncbi:hypothetical protein KCP77_06420 [Salmonella enterica subsp. enterica]|nr:hypothetical protein KCP77_06420 [Salmonella enterica subsp. enterica]
MGPLSALCSGRHPRSDAVVTWAEAVRLRHRINYAKRADKDRQYPGVRRIPLRTAIFRPCRSTCSVGTPTAARCTGTENKATP